MNFTACSPCSSIARTVSAITASVSSMMRHSSTGAMANILPGKRSTISCRYELSRTRAGSVCRRTPSTPGVVHLGVEAERCELRVPQVRRQEVFCIFASFPVPDDSPPRLVDAEPQVGKVVDVVRPRGIKHVGLAQSPRPVSAWPAGDARHSPPAPIAGALRWRSTREGCRGPRSSMRVSR